MITQELIAYVKSELNKGRTREEIRVNLLQGGGWSESDISEVFRVVTPLENATVLKPEEMPTVPAFKPIEITPEPNIGVSPAPLEDKSSPRPLFTAAFISASIIGLCLAVFYFYRPQVLGLPERAMAGWSSFSGKISGWMQKEETFEPKGEKIPAVSAVLGRNAADCGATNSPDRKKPASFFEDAVLECLGVHATECTEATGTINDALFPTRFRVMRGNVCKFELSYQANSALRNVFGKKLAGRNIICPISAVKTIDETDPKNPMLKAAKTDNPGEYAADMYFYATLGVFIENNFDQKKIENLGCSGSFIKSMIESYNLTKPKT